MLRESINLATWLTRQVTVYFVKAIGRTTSLELIFQKKFCGLEVVGQKWGQGGQLSG